MIGRAAAWILVTAGVTLISLVAMAAVGLPLQAFFMWLESNLSREEYIAAMGFVGIAVGCVISYVNGYYRAVDKLIQGRLKLPNGLKAYVVTDDEAE